MQIEARLSHLDCRIKGFLADGPCQVSVEFQSFMTRLGALKRRGTPID